MADVTKLVDRGIPSIERSQVFTEADAGAGDVIRVDLSLGRPGSKMVVDAVLAMTIRVNVKRTVFAQRQLGDDFSEFGGPNLAKGVTFNSDSMTPIAIGAGETFELEDDLPIQDIEITTAAGAFSIYVS